MSSKFIIIRVLLFVLLVVGTTSAMIAQDNDFTTWTKFKVNHKIDSRFAVSGDCKTGTLHRGFGDAHQSRDAKFGSALLFPVIWN